MCDNMFNMNELRLLKDMTTFQTLQTWIGHNATRYQLQTRYHTRYHTLYHIFSLSSTWIGHNGMRCLNFNLLLHALPYIFSQFSMVWRHLQRVRTEDHQIY